MTETQSHRPDGKLCIRPYILNGFVRTKFEEAARRYASQKRRAAFFPASPSPQLNPPASAPKSDSVFRGFNNYVAAKRKLAVPHVQQCSDSRICEEGGSIQQSNKKSRWEFAQPVVTPQVQQYTTPRTRAQRTTPIEVVKTKAGPGIGVKAFVPPRRLDSTSKAPNIHHARPLFKSVNKTNSDRGEDDARINADADYVTLEDRSPPRPTYHLYRIDGDGSTHTLPITVKPTSQKTIKNLSTQEHDESRDTSLQGLNKHIVTPNNEEASHQIDLPQSQAQVAHKSYKFSKLKSATGGKTEKLINENPVLGNNRQDEVNSITPSVQLLEQEKKLEEQEFIILSSDSSLEIMPNDREKEVANDGSQDSSDDESLPDLCKLAKGTVTVDPLTPHDSTDNNETIESCTTNEQQTVIQECNTSDTPMTDEIANNTVSLHDIQNMEKTQPKSDSDVDSEASTIIYSQVHKAAYHNNIDVKKSQAIDDNVKNKSLAMPSELQNEKEFEIGGIAVQNKGTEAVVTLPDIQGINETHDAATDDIDSEASTVIFSQVLKDERCSADGMTESVVINKNTEDEILDKISHLHNDKESKTSSIEVQQSEIESLDIQKMETFVTADSHEYKETAAVNFDLHLDSMRESTIFALKANEVDLQPKTSEMVNFDLLNDSSDEQSCLIEDESEGRDRVTLFPANQLTVYSTSKVENGEENILKVHSIKVKFWCPPPIKFGTTLVSDLRNDNVTLETPVGGVEQQSSGTHDISKTSVDPCDSVDKTDDTKAHVTEAGIPVVEKAGAELSVEGSSCMSNVIVDSFGHKDTDLWFVDPSSNLIISNGKVVIPLGILSNPQSPKIANNPNIIVGSLEFKALMEAANKIGDTVMRVENLAGFEDKNISIKNADGDEDIGPLTIYISSPNAAVSKTVFPRDDYVVRSVCEIPELHASSVGKVTDETKLLNNFSVVKETVPCEIRAGRVQTEESHKDVELVEDTKSPYFDSAAMKNIEVIEITEGEMEFMMSTSNICTLVTKEEIFKDARMKVIIHSDIGTECHAFGNNDVSKMAHPDEYNCTETSVNARDVHNGCNAVSHRKEMDTGKEASRDTLEERLIKERQKLILNEIREDFLLMGERGIAMKNNKRRKTHIKGKLLSVAEESLRRYVAPVIQNAEANEPLRSSSLQDGFVDIVHYPSVGKNVDLNEFGRENYHTDCGMMISQLVSEDQLDGSEKNSISNDQHFEDIQENISCKETEEVKENLADVTKNRKSPENLMDCDLDVSREDDRTEPVMNQDYKKKNIENNSDTMDIELDIKDGNSVNDEVNSQAYMDTVSDQNCGNPVDGISYENSGSDTVAQSACRMIEIKDGSLVVGTLELHNQHYNDNTSLCSQNVSTQSIGSTENCEAKCDEDVKEILGPEKATSDLKGNVEKLEENPGEAKSETDDLCLEYQTNKETLLSTADDKDDNGARQLEEICINEPSAESPEARNVKVMKNFVTEPQTPTVKVFNSISMDDLMKRISEKMKELKPKSSVPGKPILCQKVLDSNFKDFTAKLKPLQKMTEATTPGESSHFIDNTNAEGLLWSDDKEDTLVMNTLPRKHENADEKLLQVLNIEIHPQSKTQSIKSDSESTVICFSATDKQASTNTVVPEIVDTFKNPPVASCSSIPYGNKEYCENYVSQFRNLQDSCDAHTDFDRIPSCSSVQACDGQCYDDKQSLKTLADEAHVKEGISTIDHVLTVDEKTQFNGQTPVSLQLPSSRINTSSTDTAILKTYSDQQPHNDKEAQRKMVQHAVSESQPFAWDMLTSGTHTQSHVTKGDSFTKETHFLADQESMNDIKSHEDGIHSVEGNSLLSTNAVSFLVAAEQSTSDFNKLPSKIWSFDISSDNNSVIDTHTPTSIVQPSIFSSDVGLSRDTIRLSSSVEENSTNSLNHSSSDNLFTNDKKSLSNGVEHDLNADEHENIAKTEEMGKTSDMEIDNKEDIIASVPVVSRNEKRHRIPTLNRLDVFLNDVYKDALKLLVNEGESLMSSLRRNEVSSIGVNQDFLSLKPYLTRLLLHQLVRSRKLSPKVDCTEKQHYRDLLTVHGLVKATELLLHCGFESACNSLQQFCTIHQLLIPNCYDVLLLKLDAIQSKRDVTHPKMQVVREEMHRLRKRKDPAEPDVKVLVVCQRESESVFEQLKKGLKESAVCLLSGVPDYQTVLQRLDHHSVLVWTEGKGVEHLPCSQFSLMVEWEAAATHNSLSCVNHYLRQHIRVVSLSTVLQKEDISTPAEKHPAERENKTENDCEVVVDETGNTTKEKTTDDKLETFSFIASPDVVSNAELHYILTSIYNINLVERSVRDLVEDEESDRGWADLVVDERTCILIKPLAELRSDAFLNLLIKHLVLLSLQTTHCYLLLYHDPSSFAGYIFRSGIVKALTRLVAMCAQMKVSDYEVSILYAYNLQQVGEWVRKVSESARDTSTSFDKEDWTKRPWLTPQMSSHERLLLTLPCLNPVSAQIILTAVSLRQVFTMSLAELMEALPWLPYKVVTLMYRLLHSERSHACLEDPSLANVKEETLDNDPSTAADNFALTAPDTSLHTSCSRESNLDYFSQTAFHGDEEMDDFKYNVSSVMHLPPSDIFVAVKPEDPIPEEDHVASKPFINETDFPHRVDYSFGQSVARSTVQGQSVLASEMASVLLNPTEYLSSVADSQIPQFQPLTEEQYTPQQQRLHHDQFMQPRGFQQAEYPLDTYSQRPRPIILPSSTYPASREQHQEPQVIVSPYFVENYQSGYSPNSDLSTIQQSQIGYIPPTPQYDYSSETPKCSTSQVSVDCGNHPGAVGPYGHFGRRLTSGLSHSQQSDYFPKSLPVSHPSLASRLDKPYPRESTPWSMAVPPPSPRVTLRQDGRGHDYPDHYEFPTSQVKIPKTSNVRLGYTRIPGNGGQTKLICHPHQFSEPRVIQSQVSPNMKLGYKKIPGRRGQTKLTLKPQ